MRDDEIPEDLPPDDPAAMLERLDDGYEDAGIPGEEPPSGSPLSPREIDEFVDQVLTEEVTRLNDAKKKR